MSEWKEVQLNETCDLIAGYAFKSKDFGNYPTKVLKIADINPPFVSSEKSSGVDLSNYDVDKLEKYIVKKGDYILAMTGATIGKMGRYVSDGHAYLNQRVLKFKPNKSIDSDFLYYVLCGRLFAKYIINHIDSESAQPNISAGTIGKYRFNLPNFETQQKIASILSSLDSKIENNRKICANLEAQAQALFKHWFIEFAPFKVGKFVESVLGMIPEGWRVGKLGEIADINPSRTIQKGNKATYLDMKNMPTIGSFPLSWEVKEYNGGMKFMNGDTLMARITPCLENGKVAYVNFLQNKEIAFGSTEYIVMSPKNNLFSEYLYFLCRYSSFINYATKNMNGSSGRQRVSGDTISNYDMIIAPKEIYKEVEPIFKDIMCHIKSLGQESILLSSLRDTLLPKLMSGEIKL